jgi:hypothetical protein
VPSRRAELDQARQQVEHAQKRIEEQIDLIERLRADGHDVRLAELLLVTLLDVRLKFSRHLDALEGKP